MHLGSEINPAVAARVLDVEKKSGLPRKYVEENLDEMERAVALKSFDPMHFRANSPKFAAWLAGDPHALAVAKKDLSQMSWFEKNLALWEAGGAAADPKLIALYGKELEGKRLTAQETVEMAVLKKRQQTAQQAIERSSGIPWAMSAGGYAVRQAEDSIPVGMGGALGGLGLGLTVLGGPVALGARILGPLTARAILGGSTLLGGVTAGAIYSYNLESASAFGEFKDEKDVNGKQLVDVQLARGAARAYGVMASVVETGSDAALGGLAAKLMPGLNALKQKFGAEGAKLALKQATKEMLANPTKRAVFAKMAGGVVGAGGLQALEEVAQTFLQALAGDVMKGKSEQTFAPTDWGKVSGDAADAAKQAFVGSLFIGGPIGAVGAKLRLNEVAQAQENQKVLQALGETMAQSDMVKNAPDVAAAAVDAITADTKAQNVYVPVATWNALFQADARGAAQEILGDTAQYDEAMSLTGADIVIPIGKYAAKVAGTPLHEKLTPDLRLEQGGLSAREATEAMANAEKLVELFGDDAKSMAEANVRMETISKEAYDMVRPFMGEREATRYGALQSARYVIRAARLDGDIDPVELYRREAPIVQRDFAARASETALASDTNFATMMKDSRLTTTGETWSKPGDEISFYTGSAADITAFRPKQAGAVFLSPDPATASEYAARRAGPQGEGGAVYKVYASARKPFDYDNQAHVDDIASALEGVNDRDIEAASASQALRGAYKTRGQLIEGIRKGAWGAIEHPAVQKIIKAQRYDAFWVMEEGVKNIGIYDPKNIKSATGNRGTYDTTKDNMLYQSDPDEDDAQDDLVESTVQDRVPTTVDDTAALETVSKRAMGAKWNKGRDLKEAMQDAVLAAAARGGVNVSVPSPQTTEYLMRIGVRDALFALKQNPNASGWYDLKTRQALAIVALIHPEVGTDLDARLAFTWALAVTSNGMEVSKNFELAEQVYNYYKAHGVMPTDVQAGQAQIAINKSLRLFNRLVGAWTAKNLRRFMLTQFTVGEITALSKDLTPGGEHAATQVRGAAILGPKIGNGFFSNLNGYFDALTMDRWLIRTWGRWTGTLIKDQPNQTLGARGRLREVVDAVLADPEETARLQKLVGTTLLAGLPIDVLAVMVQEVSIKPEKRAELNQTALGGELRKAGNNLAMYLDGQKEAPAGPNERNYIRSVFAGVLAELQTQHGYADLTMADLQAALWYAEKRLYETAKEAEGNLEGYNDNEAPDYANAAAALARDQGVSERRINAALRREEHGRAGAARLPDGAAGQAAGAEEVSRRGFTKGQKRLFIGAVATRRVRSHRALDAGESWSYGREDRGGSGSFRVLKLGKGITGVAQWKPGRGLGQVFRANGISTPVFVELDRTSPANVQRFIEAITDSKTHSGAPGAAVAVYPAEDYANMRLFLAIDGKSGVAVKSDGDIVSVFSAGGAGRSVMELAVAAGGVKLDAFETILPEFYAAHGFVATSRVPWDDAQAPDGWDQQAMGEYNGGKPDVVLMVLDKTHQGYHEKTDGKRFKGSSYGAAVRLQSRKVIEFAPRNSGPLFQADPLDRLYQPAYHGTPHEVDAFSLDKIGTGEGAQAYGWGLYFAENPGVAEGYASRLGRMARSDGSNLPSIRKLAQAAGVSPYDIGENIRENYDLAISDPDGYNAFREVLEEITNISDSLDERDVAYKLLAALPEPKGSLYQVDIPDDAVARMLDWDKPLSEQAPAVKKALEGTDYEIGLSYREIERLADERIDAEAQEWADENDGDPVDFSNDVDRDAYIEAIEKEQGGVSPRMTGEELYARVVRDEGYRPSAFESATEYQQSASQYLASLGIPGIKYLDAGSRTANDGTRNLVVFDDKLITITHKDGKPVTQAERKAFLQKIGEGPRSTVRGQFERAPAGQRPIITLFKSANPSTIWHELSHSWLEELRRDAEGPNATQQLKDDWATVRKAAGIPDLKPGEQIPRNSHEWFARGSEAYVREGKAPSLELRSVFAQFATWLKQIYKSIRNLIAEDEINPEFAAVMDRLLATDEQIAAAREEAAFEATALPVDELTKAEATEYQKLVAEVKLEAEERVRTQAMNEIVRERTDWWRAEKALVTREVEAEVNTRPEYQARSWLRTGRLLDGSTLEGIQHARLDRQAIVTQYGQGMLQKLAFLYQAENGLHPDDIAQAFGYESGDQMLRAIVDSPPRREVISAEVDKRMLERHGDMLNDGGLAERAIEAVHSDKQAEVLLTELRILKRLGAVGELTTWKAIRNLATTIVGRKMVGDLRAKHYVSAGAKAGYEAERAMIGKDYTHAFDAKLQQLMNLALVQEVTQRKAAVDKAMRTWKLFDRSDDRLSKSRDINLVNTARAVLANYGIGKKGDSAVAYLELVQEYDPATYDDLIELVQLVSAEEKPYTILTVEEFTQMQEIVDGLWQLSRNAQQSMVDGQKINRDQIKAELLDGVATLGLPANQRGVKQAMTEWEKYGVKLLDARAAGTRMEHWFAAMDRHIPGAPFTKYLWNPVSEAVTRYREARTAALTKFRDLAKSMEGRITKDKIAAPEIDYVFKNRAELLGAIAHTGNLSNKLDKLLPGGRPGHPWGEFNPDGTFNSDKWDAFIRRAQRDGILTKVDYDFIQGLWDLMEELKPAAQAAHKEMYGYYFDEITANAFDTPWGTYKGGYMPASTDPFLVPAAAERADKAALAPQAATFSWPTTGRGATKTRKKNYHAPLQLDIGLVQQHIDWALRFAYIEPRVREVARIAMDPKFRATIAAHVDSEIVSQAIVPWLDRTAKQQVERPSDMLRILDGAARFLRSNTNMQLMSGNLNNTLQNVTGFSSALTKVKGKYMRNAFYTYISAPGETAEAVANASAFMRNRMSKSAFDVQREINDFLLDPSKFDKAKDFAARHAYVLQQVMQNFMDVIIWRGAYNQAIDGGLTPADAVRASDSAVRLTQGSFAPEDVSRLETGPPTWRAMTMFWSYFNNQANLLGFEAGDAYANKSFTQALHLYLFIFVPTATIAQFIAEGMSGELWDDDDDDGYLDNFLSTFFLGQFKFLAGLLPGVGHLANLAINKMNDKWYDDRLQTSPIFSTLESAVSAPVSMYSAIANDGSWKKAIKDTFTLLGFVTGLPTSVLARPLGYAADVEQGRVEPANAADYIRGLITGRGTPQ